MSKTKFSSSIARSIEGRFAPVVSPVERQTDEGKKSVSDKGQATIKKPQEPEPIIQKSGHGRGRPKLDDAQKKKQMILTVAPETQKIIADWATETGRSGTKVISSYVDEHIEEILGIK